MNLRSFMQFKRNKMVTNDEYGDMYTMWMKNLLFITVAAVKAPFQSFRNDNSNIKATHIIRLKVLIVRDCIRDHSFQIQWLCHVLDKLLRNLLFGATLLSNEELNAKGVTFSILGWNKKASNDFFTYKFKVFDYHIFSIDNNYY